jgi:hypothetical protein
LIKFVKIIRVEIISIIHQTKNLVLNLELSSSEEDKKKYLSDLKETLDKLESDYLKLEQTQDLVVSHLKQELSRLNRL